MPATTKQIKEINKVFDKTENFCIHFKESWQTYLASIRAQEASHRRDGMRWGMPLKAAVELQAITLILNNIVDKGGPERIEDILVYNVQRSYAKAFAVFFNHKISNIFYVDSVDSGRTLREEMINFLDTHSFKNLIQK